MDSPAKFIEGILFNGLINFKGDSLAAFLKQIGSFPKKVIYIEDKPKHLQQVGETIEALGIPFLGVHFGALEKQRQEYRADLAAIQVKFHQDILDDDTAGILTGRGSSTSMTSRGTEKSIYPTIESIWELKELFTPETLLITELDHTLFEAQGVIGSRYFLSYLKDKLIRLGESPAAAHRKAARTFEKIHRRAKVTPIEQNTKDFLRQHSCIAISFRPQRLLSRTDEQIRELGWQFHTPSDSDDPIVPSYLLLESNTDSSRSLLREKLREVNPSRLVAVSAFSEDLKNWEEVALQLGIPFEGRLFSSTKQRDFALDELIIEKEYEKLEHLLTNQEAEQLL